MKDKIMKNKEIILKVLIILIILIAMVTSFLMTNSKRRIIEKSFSSISNNLKYYKSLVDENFIDEDEYTLSSSITPKIQIDSKDTLNTNIDIDKFNNTKINYVIEKDDEDIKTNFDITINNQTIKKFETIMIDNNYYLKINDDWKLISNKTLSVDDLEYIKNILRKEIKDNLKSEYFSSEKNTISLNGKDEKVKKVSVTIIDEQIYSLLNNVLKQLKSDKKAVEILKKVNFSLDDIKLDKESFKDYKIIYSVYKKNTYGKYVAYDLSIQNKTDSFKISYTTDKDDKLEINYNDNDIVIKTTKDSNNFNSVIKVNNNEVATIKCNKEKNKFTANLDVYFDKYYFDVNYENNYEKNNKEYTINGKTSLTIKYDNNSVLELTLDNKGTLSKKVNEIKKINNAKEELSIYELYNSINELIDEYKLNNT